MWQGLYKLFIIYHSAWQCLKETTKLDTAGFVYVPGTDSYFRDVCILNSVVLIK